MSVASVHKLFEKVMKELDSELAVEDLHPILRANYLSVQKDCESLLDALMQIGVEEISAATNVVNEKIEARFADPDDQVDPMAPHTFPDEVPMAAEAVEAESDPAVD